MLAAMGSTPPKPGSRRSARDGAREDARLLREFARTLSALSLHGRRVLVAVSGGRDSCVLLDLFRRCAPALELELVVGHVHHGLRGNDADLDAAHAEALARDAGLAFRSARVEPEAARRVRPSRIRPSLEEAARNLRRTALVGLARESGCQAIATAHHAGDQAETVLLRLLRGTGPDGLAGMAPRSDDGLWLKPLLGVAPERIAAWARSHDLRWREDASNADRQFSRNRVRLDLLPMLAEGFNPRLLRALGDLAEAARTDRRFLEAQVDLAARDRIEWRAPVLRFALEGWASIPDAIARRLVRRGLTEAGLGREVTRVQLLRVLAFLRRGRRAGRDKKVELPGGFSLRRVDDHFALARSRTMDDMEDADEKVGEGSGC